MPHKDRAIRLLLKKRWYETNAETIRAKRLAKRIANREARREKDKAWYRAHREKLIQDARARRGAHPERHRASSKAWRIANKERCRDINRRGNQRRRATERWAFVEYIDRDVVFGRDKGKCGICQCDVDPMSKWHIDHVVPLAKGGLHHYGNVQLAHADCNITKGTSV